MLDTLLSTLLALDAMVRVVVKFWLNEVHCVHTELTIQYCLNDGRVTHDYIYFEDAGTMF